jgi:uncharacterized membrane protein
MEKDSSLPTWLKILLLLFGADLVYRHKKSILRILLFPFTFLLSMPLLILLGIFFPPILLLLLLLVFLGIWVGLYVRKSMREYKPAEEKLTEEELTKVYSLAKNDLERGIINNEQFERVRGKMRKYWEENYGSS